jgi:uncharacterized membrane protein YoaK (UPF0700 family)
MAQSRRVRIKSAIALVLTFSAGFVDIVGALTVYNLFTAHVTGATVQIGELLIQRNWKAAIVAISVVFAFFFGSVLGRVVIETGARLRFRRIATVTLSIQIVLLLGVIALGSRIVGNGESRITSIPLICLLLMMLAAAMGLQTSTLTRVGALTVHTTFVTGMLNKLAQLSSRWMFLRYDLSHRPFSAEQRSELRLVTQESEFMVAIWLLYLAGSVCGAWLGIHSRFSSLYLPCALTFAAIVTDQIRPLSIEEERQSEG